MVEPSCHKVCWNGIKVDCQNRLITCVTCCRDCKGHIKENGKRYIMFWCIVASIIVGCFGFVITVANSMIYNEEYLILGICLLIISIVPWIVYGIVRVCKKIYDRYKEEYLYSPGPYSDLDL